MPRCWLCQLFLALRACGQVPESDAFLTHFAAKLGKTTIYDSRFQSAA